MPAAAICLRILSALATLHTGPRLYSGSVGSPSRYFWDGEHVERSADEGRSREVHLCELDEPLHELVIDRLVNIDTLKAAMDQDGLYPIDNANDTSMAQQLCPELKKAPDTMSFLVYRHRMRRIYRQQAPVLYNLGLRLHARRRGLFLRATHVLTDRPAPTMTILTSRPTPLKPGACAAAISTARPPATLPVNATKSTRGFWTAFVVSSGLR